MKAVAAGLGLPMSSALRALIATVRTWGHLPVVRRLMEDAAALDLGPLAYIQLALHQRYRVLVNSPAASELGRGPRRRRAVASRRAR